MEVLSVAPVFSLPKTSLYGGVRDDMVTGCVSALARRLETELRAAKSAQLACGEVLLPPDLLQRVAADVFALAEVEPCGIRGCTLYVEFLSADLQNCRRIATVKWDPNTVSTFELTLTLKQDPRSASWTSILPQFIKNLTRGGTIMISHSFDISKKKLYRSYLE
ncbi:Protein hook [Nesidiocoris tenuis]|uniref:Protein hook n=1 Tax=Nesidiocoris tenuis TaxID=355587 RepID=A0ABN7AP86_9HEMI|nr:Protein hook [Nesidiocoris tenuis]